MSSPIKWTLLRPNKSITKRATDFDPHYVSRGKREIGSFVPRTLWERRAIAFMVQACNEKERRDWKKRQKR